MSQKQKDAFARRLNIWLGVLLIVAWFGVAFGSVGAQSMM